MGIWYYQLGNPGNAHAPIGRTFALCRRPADEASLIPRLHDGLARDRAAFEVVDRQARHRHAIGLGAGLAEGDTVTVG